MFVYKFDRTADFDDFKNYFFDLEIWSKAFFAFIQVNISLISSESSYKCPLYFQVCRMGGYWLEIGKMALYLSFPVTMFHYFNQPEYFEKWVTQTKREVFPPENQSHARELEELKRTIRARRNEELMKSISDMDDQKNKAM